MSEFKSDDGFHLYGDSHDRLRAANRAAGWPEPTAEDLRHADHGGELLAGVFFQDGGSGWPDDSPERGIAGGVALEAINAWSAHRAQREALGDTKFKALGPMVTTHSVEVWKNRRSIADLDNAFRLPKLLCIVAGKPKKAYPLDKFEDWRFVAADSFGPCDVRISAQCHGSIAAIGTPLVRGEYVVAIRVCDPCWRWPYSASAALVDRFRDMLTEHHVEPTDADRKAQLLAIADRGLV